MHQNPSPSTRTFRDSDGGTEPSGPRLYYEDRALGAPVELNWDALTIRGTCSALEKEYFRLTSAPDPSSVRPEPVLEKALARLLSLWAERPENRKSGTPYMTKSGTKVDYEYLCSQFKAIRQDITVQRIKGSLAVRVYEAHARVALEENDVNEYNQCQTQLKELYKEGYKGAWSEFTAYRILYYLVLQTTQTYTGGSKDMLGILAEVSKSKKDHAAVAHALKVREAMAAYDYHSFFRLLKTAPNLSGRIMLRLQDKVRLYGLSRMIKAYRPSIEAEFVLEELGLPLPSQSTEGIEYLRKCGIVFTEDNSAIDCKNSSVSNEGLRAEKKPNSLL